MSLYRFPSTGAGGGMGNDLEIVVDAEAEWCSGAFGPLLSKLRDVSDAGSALIGTDVATLREVADAGSALIGTGIDGTDVESRAV